MKKPSNIAHPLKNRTGTSQRNRVIQALGSDAAPIDGKTLADRLFLISEYARQINFYQYKITEIHGESQELDNWSLFFKDSLPFQLSVLSKISGNALDTQFSLLYEELKANPSKQSLESLFNFVFNKIIAPTTLLFKTVQKEENSFTESLLAILQMSFSEAVKSFICLYNASANFLCIPKKNFNDFLNAPWQLKVENIYAIDLCIQQVEKGEKEAFLKAAEVLDTIFQQVLSGMQSIINAAPDYIDESLIPLKESLQKKHEPHLALLFAFLELFKHFQGNINELTKKHLDFFYEEVLKMIPKDAVPDKAHIVFEVANHKNQYLLKKDLLLKDGKDSNKQDIQFGLEHEIVLDKAQIKDLKTLSLYPIKDNNDKKYIEGVYIAPVATTADGLDKDFKDDQPKNWPTLGSKFSKCLLEENETPEEYPKARLGFVLASPVLLLEEGNRTINITLDCVSIDEIEFPIADIQQKLAIISESKIVYNLSEDLFGDFLNYLEHPNDFLEEAKEYLKSFFKTIDKNKIFKDDLVFKSNLNRLFSLKIPGEDEELGTDDDKDAFNTEAKEKVEEFLRGFELEVQVIDKSFFKLSFSGEKEWLAPNLEDVTIITPPISGDNKMSLEIVVKLESDFPSILFYNEDKLKEKIDLKTNFPLVKIELKDERINCEIEETDKTDCCLKKKNESKESIDISIYHFLQKLVVDDAQIDVEVCGVKNLIVQNDENLQDVNKPMVPFGPRPKVDAAFVIGSREVFCKNWQSFRLGVEWKDRPENFEEYYKAYNLEDSVDIDNDVFEIEAGVLDEGNWEMESEPFKKVFESKDFFPPCPLINEGFKFNGYTWGRSDFPISSYVEKSMPSESLSPLTVNSRKAYFRIRLKGEDFQHDSYAFVLAKQMMALANILDPKSIETIRDEIENAVKLCDESEIRIDDIKNWPPGTLGELIDEVEKFPNIPLLPFLNIGDIPSDVPDDLSPYGLEKIDESLCRRIDIINNVFIANDADNAILPNEPYTPTLKSIFVDYHAIATKEDMDIIHLYPYENTSKYENIEDKPTLFPCFKAKEDEIINGKVRRFLAEGTLFIGLESVTTGGSLSILFQLAEATADSELDRAEIYWHYLRKNEWEPLEYDFDVISDDTDGFTVSGIATIAIPDDINNIGNTVMPDPLYWIRVTAPENVKAVAETIGIHTQAAKTSARFNELSDKNRLEKALESGSIAKLVEGDFNVKKVEQLYPSFGGRTPEANGHFYTRVSEHLKHKGRASLLNDYEKIVLEGFPEIYKAKCITHTMGLSAIEYSRDLEIAPGYVVVTVIPDLTKLEAGNLKEPKIPVSILEKIGDHIRKRTSPFARLKVMNPRFEKVNITITVRLYRGKSDSFYKQKLKDDLNLFLAPWSLGDSEKLAFGQVVLFSDIVGFVEKLEYVDFVSSLDLNGECGQTGTIIKPLTARSVLTGGIICVDTNKEECADTKECIESKEVVTLI